MKSKMCAQVRKATRKRPRNRSGWGNLIEYCCGDESQLGKAARNFDGASVTRVTKGVDAYSNRTHRQLRDIVSTLP
eukprot:9766658-Karenia_brevis.AAC.1